MGGTIGDRADFEPSEVQESPGGIGTVHPFEPINSEGSIRRQTDTEYEFVFKADKEIDTGDIDFNGEPDAYERAVEYLASQGVDVSGFRLADTEFVKIGEEESDDLIFVGDRDDLANAYILQGTLTLHYRKTEIYKNFED